MVKQTLQRKILIMVIALISFVMIIMQGLFIYTDYKRIFSRIEADSLSTAKIISYLNNVQQAILTNDERQDLNPLIDYYKLNANASFIIVKDREGKILAHPETPEINQIKEEPNEFKAIVFGGYYTTRSEELFEQSIVGVAPIFNDQDQVIGTVKVGYFVNELYKEIFERAKRIFYIGIWIFIIALLSSWLLARNIRKDTLGLEPKQIAELYTERHAILSSISEGVVAIDKKGKISMMNLAAEQILGLSSTPLKQSIYSILPGFSVEEFKKIEKHYHSLELTINEKVLIFSAMPLRHQSIRIGTVITFRDKTETAKIVNELFEVSRYSEDLRAQTHEFANKLYAISGLLQLGNYEEAILMIQEEIDVNETTNTLIFEQIKDPNVQAILLGKMGKASESKVTFTIDGNSSLELLPPFIRTAPLSTIIGNLIDNAFEAVALQDDGEVHFFALDLGNDIIFEVSDNGTGIEEGLLDEIFKPKYSSKSNDNNRGYGLANVQQIVTELNGDIQVSSDEHGTIFSVYIPKKRKGECQ